MFIAKVIKKNTIWCETALFRFMMTMEKRYSVKKQLEIIMFLLMESYRYHRSHKELRAVTAVYNRQTMPESRLTQKQAGIF
ncbi:hypothetical protein CRM93_04230 [Acetobacter fabarum]|nr:hypothetical protein CRM93_04230 [Acetobacter fabarum]